jgi:hypothetical protein
MTDFSNIGTVYTKMTKINTGYPKFGEKNQNRPILIFFTEFLNTALLTRGTSSGSTLACSRTESNQQIFIQTKLGKHKRQEEEISIISRMYDRSPFPIPCERSPLSHDPRGQIFYPVSPLFPLKASCVDC